MARRVAARTGGTTIARKSRGRDGPTEPDALDDRSLLQLARGGDQASARVLAGRYVGGIHAFVHARVGSLVAEENTAAIFDTTIRSLDRDSLVDGSMARALHEQAIARIILDDQEIHDPRLARLADVLAAESIVAEPAPESVHAAAVAAILAAVAEMPARVIDGPLTEAITPPEQPRRPDEIGRPAAPVPPLAEPEVPRAPEARASRSGLLILLLVLVAVGAVVAGILLFGDTDAIRDLLP